MRKDANILDKAKNVIKFLLGERLPAWIYPVTAAAAAAPVIGYELEKHKEKPVPDAQPLAPWLRARSLTTGVDARDQFPMLTKVHPSVFKYGHHEGDMDKAAASISRHLGMKSAAGLDELNSVIQEAKRRGQKRKAVRSIDVKPGLTKPEDKGPGARGVSSGTAVSGNGGGYGR